MPLPLVVECGSASVGCWRPGFSQPEGLEGCWLGQRPQAQPGGVLHGWSHARPGRRRQAEARPSLHLVLKWALQRGVFSPSQGREVLHPISIRCALDGAPEGDRKQQAKALSRCWCPLWGSLGSRRASWRKEAQAPTGARERNQTRSSCEGQLPWQGLLALAAFPGTPPGFPPGPLRRCGRQCGQSWRVSGKLQWKSCQAHLFLQRDVLCVGSDLLCRKQGTLGALCPPLTPSELSAASVFPGFPEPENVGARKHLRKRLGSAF